MPSPGRSATERAPPAGGVAPRLAVDRKKPPFVGPAGVFRPRPLRHVAGYPGARNWSADLSDRLTGRQSAVPDRGNRSNRYIPLASRHAPPTRRPARTGSAKSSTTGITCRGTVKVTSCGCSLETATTGAPSIWRSPSPRSGFAPDRSRWTARSWCAGLAQSWPRPSQCRNSWVSRARRDGQPSSATLGT